MNEETLDFIRQHADDDVRQLALQGARAKAVDLPYALNQIAGRQQARQKLPSWAAIEGLTYPPHISMEQCSSEKTARYKAAVAERLLGDDQRACMADLTGGFGVDFSFLASTFRKAVYVEQQPHLCEAARHNFQLLGLTQAEVVQGDGVSYLRQMEPVDLLYIDPARRDSHGQRTFGIADCTPNILEIADEMAEKSHYCIIKLSPMLDWHQAVAELENDKRGGHKKHITEVHIISSNNECKELLLVLSRQDSPKKSLYCVNDEQQFVLDISQTAVSLLCKAAPVFIGDSLELRTERLFQDDNGELRTDRLFQDDNGELRTERYDYSQGSGSSSKGNHTSQFSTLSSQLVLSPLNYYLFEPNASIMKAGCFDAVAERFGVRQVGNNSHWFVATQDVAEFPGRRFQIERVTSMNKRELKTALSGIEKANIAVRNFPLSVAELRKRLRLKDGGDHYLFATTVADRNHVLMVCRKV